MRALAALFAFGSALVALTPTRTMAPPPRPGDDKPVFSPVVDDDASVVRRDLNASSAGADRKWIRAVRDLVEDRLDVDGLAPGTPITVWTVDDDVVAFQVEGRFAARAFAADDDSDGGALRWVFDDGTSLDGPFLSRPVRYYAVASRIGVREHPVTHQTRWHAGTDLAAAIGTPVRAAGDGVITHWSRSWTGGKMLVLKHDDGFETKYLHLNDKVDGIEEGVRVHEGQVIAYVGKTGRVTGPHLHFEVRDRWGTPIDAVVYRGKGNERVSASALDELRRRRDLLKTFGPDGSRDLLANPTTIPPLAMDALPPVDNDDKAVAIPAFPVRKSETKAARGPSHTPHRRIHTTHPVFDADVRDPAVQKDALARRAMLLAAEFPDDPVPS